MSGSVPETFDQARESSVRWMKRLEERSDYEWEWVTPSRMVTEPSAEFPCYVMPLVTGDRERGYTARLAYTAGVKHEGRYWQGRLPDGYADTVLSEQLLERLDSILGVLIVASRLSHGAWPRPRRIHSRSPS